jgi:hypothetical protein
MVHWRNAGASPSRRELLAGVGALLAAPPKPRVAAIVTTYYYWSHADVIAGRILEGYSPDGRRVEPRTRIVSMYVDQFAPKDLSRGLAAKHGFTIFPTVADALTLGGAKLAVDAVLLIGEHGDYPDNERGQKLYPRFELFQQIADVCRASGRAVPVFCDKHLSWSWQKADRMYRQAAALKIPFMAGSSIPVTIRRPPLELPLGVRLENAVAAGYGDLDAYGFHTLEGLQCMVERRRGGETGIRSVEWIEGEAVWRWRDGEGRWSAPLLDAALKTASSVKPGPAEGNATRPVLFLLEYNDGLRAAAYMLDGHVKDFLFAAKQPGKPDPAATCYVLEASRPLPHFDALVHAIEEFFVSRRPQYPVERTLLTSGALSFLFEARGKRPGRMLTPELAVRYAPPSKAYVEQA